MRNSLRVMALSLGTLASVGYSSIAHASLCDDPATAWALVRRASQAQEAGQFEPVRAEVTQLSQCQITTTEKNSILQRAQDEAQLIELSMRVRDATRRLATMPRPPANITLAAWNPFMQQRVMPIIQETITTLHTLAGTTVGIRPQAAGASRVNYSVRVDALALVAGVFVSLAQTVSDLAAPPAIRNDPTQLAAYRTVIDDLVTKIYDQAHDFYMSSRVAEINNAIEPRSARVLRAQLELRGLTVDPPAESRSRAQMNAVLQNPTAPMYVRATVVAAANQIEQCYQQGLATSPAMRGRAIFHIEINATGAVTQTDVKSADPSVNAITPCVKTVLGGLTFTGIQAPVSVDYPLDFALP